MSGLFIRSGNLHQLYTSHLSIIFWWNYLEFADKMNLTIRMITFDDVFTSSCNLFEIWGQVFYSCNYVRTSCESHYLHCNQRKFTFVLS